MSDNFRYGGVMCVGCPAKNSLLVNRGRNENILSRGFESNVL